MQLHCTVVAVVKDTSSERKRLRINNGNIWQKVLWIHVVLLSPYSTSLMKTEFVAEGVSLLEGEAVSVPTNFCSFSPSPPPVSVFQRRTSGHYDSDQETLSPLCRLGLGAVITVVYSRNHFVGSSRLSVKLLVPLPPSLYIYSQRSIWQLCVWANLPCTKFYPKSGTVHH